MTWAQIRARGDPPGGQAAFSASVVKLSPSTLR